MGAALFPGVGKGAEFALPVIVRSRIHFGLGGLFSYAPFAQPAKGAAPTRGKSNCKAKRSVADSSESRFLALGLTRAPIGLGMTPCFLFDVGDHAKTACDW